jgi:hypothetical protein
VTNEAARKLAEHWIAAWNAHDLESIMTHYQDAVELTSPVAAQLLGAPAGKVIGKQNVRAYFQRGLQAIPDLRFHLENVFVGISSMVLLYKNHKGVLVAEFMELSENHTVTRVVANYAA